LVFTDAVPLHSFPEHEPEALASIFELRKALSAEMQLWTSPALTYEPLQKIAPSWLHCVLQVLASCCLHVSRLLAWHCSWHVVFACAVHEPEQSALHFVLQSSVVGIETHEVLQWSLQHALQEASQSVEDSEVEVEPSGPLEDDEEEDEVHEALQVAPQREVQSVVQSIIGGLAVHFVEQSD